MKIAAANQTLIATTPAPVKPEAAAPAAAEPKDKVETGKSEPSDGAQMAKMAFTGLGGIALAIPCTYAGLAGGAVVGTALGGAVGPITGALSNQGMWGAITSAWHTAGTMGHIGLVLGGATALAGSFALSSSIAKTVFTHGQHEDQKRINWKNWANVGAGTVLLTAGIAAGTVGGLALAGGASAAGTVVNGLLHHGFTAAALSGVGQNALIGGAIGAAVAGTVGAKGGAALTKGIARHVIDPATTAVTNLFHKSEPAKA